MAEYGPLELPSGKRIHFRAPTGADRLAVFKLTRINPDNVLSGAVLVDYYVQARCVTKINDQPVPMESYKNLFDTWDAKDVVFYQSVFNEMFGMTEEMQDKAKEAARFLLNGQTS